MRYERIKGLAGQVFNMEAGRPYPETLINAIFNVYTSNAVGQGKIHIHELHFTNLDREAGTITWHLKRWEKVGGESNSAAYAPCAATTVKLTKVFHTIDKSKHKEMALKIVREVYKQLGTFAQGGGPATLELHEEATNVRLSLVEEQGDAADEKSAKMQNEITELQKEAELTKASLALLAGKVSEMPPVVQVANPPKAEEGQSMTEEPQEQPDEWKEAEMAVNEADAQAEAAEAKAAAEVAAAAEKKEAEEAEAAARAAEAKAVKAAKAAEAKEAKAVKAAKAAEAKAAKAAKAAEAAIEAPVEKPSSKRKAPVTKPKPKAPKKQKQEETSSEEETSERPWSCKACTFVNRPLFFQCSMCEAPRDKFTGEQMKKWNKI